MFILFLLQCFTITCSLKEVMFVQVFVLTLWSNLTKLVVSFTDYCLIFILSLIHIFLEHFQRCNGIFLEHIVPVKIKTKSEINVVWKMLSFQVTAQRFRPNFKCVILKAQILYMYTNFMTIHDLSFLEYFCICLLYTSK